MAVHVAAVRLGAQARIIVLDQQILFQGFFPCDPTTGRPFPNLKVMDTHTPPRRNDNFCQPWAPCSPASSFVPSLHPFAFISLGAGPHHFSASAPSADRLFRITIVQLIGFFVQSGAAVLL